MRIGILSDTHGLLRSEVIEAMTGVDHIIHAGDIDKKSVLDELEKIATVTAVRGNADKDWAEYIPEDIILEFEGNKIYVVHNKGKIGKAAADADIIIYGHSHKYSEVTKDGQVWYNPGCCGKRKPTQEVTFGILTIKGKGDFSFERHLINTSSQAETGLPGNIHYIIEKAMSMTDRGKSIDDIAKACKIDRSLAESICRMYLTHPGVDVSGILQRIS